MDNKNPIFISNSGIIITAPYLGILFKKCDLMKDGKFVDKESSFKGVHLLQYAATGKTKLKEKDLVLNKLLCGIEITEPVDLKIVLTPKEKNIVDELLKAITQHWNSLRDTSLEGLRGSFFMRDGKLEEDSEAFFLKVEQRSYDMLLDQIPWNISKIKLSWMPKILNVLWR